MHIPMIHYHSLVLEKKFKVLHNFSHLAPSIEDQPHNLYLCYVKEFQFYYYLSLKEH